MGYEFKGTPGKWHASENDVISMADIEDGGDIICDAPEYAEDSMKRWQHNAQAIAELPELISVLAGIVERWDRVVPEEHVSEEHKRARQALAKATGGEG